MGRRCVGCKRIFITGSYSFHRFPKDPVRRAMWEASVKIHRGNFKATDHTSLCAKHFTSDCFDTNKLGGTWLKAEALPTIFDFCSSEEMNSRKRKKFMGDFKKKDMEKSSVAKSFLLIAKNEMKEKTKLIKDLQQRTRRLQEKLEKVSGTPISKWKRRKVDLNKPSTSTQEEILPDFGGAQETDISNDSSIVFKQEMIETVEEPSTFSDDSTLASPSYILPDESSSEMTVDNLSQESIAPNSPGSSMQGSNSSDAPRSLVLDNPQVPQTLSAPLSASKTIPTIVKIHERKVSEPITQLKPNEDSTITSAESSKGMVKQSGERSPSPSGSFLQDNESRGHPRDKFDVYAEFIASKLRDLDSRSCSFVQTAFANLLFEAELGRFLNEGDRNIFATKMQELLKNMPPPCEKEA